ncbi:uncharacterized protein PV07_09022 [Cladophialophora immunda]|uniref:Fungal N-terminal domain-containing protein n=1 Tax=Cladophialophora immunda TaxID=569365 RepID=A0A0D1ZDS3_9EURO|nr:uncharacterized protein PV07_09022 [Cladophialophora immunda]KIW25886.1 hypothetical protein PV07_09022 [Cladophialophora immunda]
MEPISGVVAAVVAVHTVVLNLYNITSSIRNIPLELRSIDNQCGVIRVTLSHIERILRERTEQDAQRQDNICEDLQGTLRGCQQLFEEQLGRLQGYGIGNDLNVLDQKNKKKIIKAALSRAELDFHQQRLREQFEVLRLMLEGLRMPHNEAPDQQCRSCRRGRVESVRRRSDPSPQEITEPLRQPNAGIGSRIRRICSSWSISRSSISRVSTEAQTFDSTVESSRPPIPATEPSVPHPTWTRSSKSTITVHEFESQSTIYEPTIVNVQCEIRKKSERPTTVRSSRSTPMMRERPSTVYREPSAVPAVPSLPAHYAQAERTEGTPMCPDTVQNHPTSSPGDVQTREPRAPLSEKSANAQIQRPNQVSNGQKARRRFAPGHRKTVSACEPQRTIPELAHLRNLNQSSCDLNTTQGHHLNRDHYPEDELLTATLTSVELT